MVQYSIRQAAIADLEICDRIYTENMKEYVAQAYSWRPDLFRNNFIPEEYQVIEVNSQIIGCLKVVYLENEIYLAEIQIDKDYQRQGIGRSLIQSIIHQSQTQRKILWLKVIRGNPAKQLYKQLGFKKIEESPTHEIMSRNIATE